MKQKWNYSDPIFDADKYNDTLLKYSPWSGHRRFGYDLINYYEPEVIVELGSFYGCSAFTFMQAVKDNYLKSRIFPIDLWEAYDPFTWNDYEQDVYAFFKEVKEKEFNNIDVQILKMTFDEANRKFEEKSIDILHIDGSHNYEDVKHDFEQWIPKVKENGIILFHDISDHLLNNKTLGSCEYWKEIKQQYNNTEEFYHSWGLGILFLDKDRFLDFRNKVNLNYYEKLDSYEAIDYKDRIQRDYFKLKDAAQWIESLKRDKEILEKDNNKLVDEIQKCKKDFEKGIQEKEFYIDELLGTIDKYKKTVDGKEKYINELLETIRKYTDEVDQLKKVYEQTIIGKMILRNWKKK